jgi:hypothetical protein
MRQQLWVGEDGVSLLRSGPDEPLAALEILCRACRRYRHADRRLALVAVSTRTGASRMLWVLAFTPGGGNLAAPVWSGEGDSAFLKLVCGVKEGRGGKSSGGCRHTPDVPRSWIIAQLATAFRPDTRTEIARAYR